MASTTHEEIEGLENFPEHEIGLEQEELGHVVPIWLLAGTLAVLLFLTFITVGATYFDFGYLNLVVAMAIATVKAALVLLYFMHMRWDSPFNIAVFFATLIFVFLFISVTLMDTRVYQPQRIPGYAPALEQQEQ